MSSPRSSRPSTPTGRRPPGQLLARRNVRTTPTPSPPIPREPRSRVSTISTGGSTAVNFSPSRITNIISPVFAARPRTLTGETVGELYEPISPGTIERINQEFSVRYQEAYQREQDYISTANNVRNVHIDILRGNPTYAELNSELDNLIDDLAQARERHAIYVNNINTIMETYRHIESYFVDNPYNTRNPVSGWVDTEMMKQQMIYEILMHYVRAYAYIIDIVQGIIGRYRSRMEQMRLAHEPVATTPVRAATTARGRGRPSRIPVPRNTNTRGRGRATTRGRGRRPGQATNVRRSERIRNQR